jgi:hypothetical protein
MRWAYNSTYKCSSLTYRFTNFGSRFEFLVSSILYITDHTYTKIFNFIYKVRAKRKDQFCYPEYFKALITLMQKKKKFNLVYKVRAKKKMAHAIPTLIYVNELCKVEVRNINV